MTLQRRLQRTEDREPKALYLNERAFCLVDNSAHVHHGLGQRPVLDLLNTQCAGMSQRQCHVTWKRHLARSRVRVCTACQAKVSRGRGRQASYLSLRVSRGSRAASGQPLPRDAQEET